ncbi:MAG TPA: hemolysin family protein [Acidimicrobiales bacterium]|nr:hemolysin family protein [Acidimicrobiales bacterium]
MNAGALILTVVLLAINAYFVVIEIALVAGRTARLESLLELGDRRAVAALRVVRDLPRALGTTQLGITIASLALGYISEPAVAHLIEPIIERIGNSSERAVHAIAFVIALGTITFCHHVLAETVPRNFSLAFPERILLALAPLHRAIMRLFSPIVWILNGLSKLLLRLFRVQVANEFVTAHTAAELATMLAASRDEGLIEDFEHSLLAGALDFRARPAASVMVPRERVDTVTRRMTVREVQVIASESGHSRLPVIGTSLDDVLGFVHVKDLLRLPPEADEESLPLEMLRRMLIVRPERRLEDVLRTMRRLRSHLGLVRDPGGRSLGIITLEDVLEALVGDISDETDRPV